MAARDAIPWMQEMPRPVKRRCAWVGDDPAMVRYHDREWGVPLHDDRRLFEFLILEGAQAALSWSTILRKRAAYRRAFACFEARAIAGWGAREVRTLLGDSGIVRNRAKIEAAIANARACLAVREEQGSFDAYVWRFVGGAPVRDARRLSADLRARGFRFVGPTICYAFMQATGMVNDHTRDCFRRWQVRRLGRRGRKMRG